MVKNALIGKTYSNWAYNNDGGLNVQEVTVKQLNQSTHGIGYIHLAFFVLYISVFEDLITFSLRLIGVYTPITDYISQVGFISVTVLILLDLFRQRRVLLPTIAVFVITSLLFLMNYRQYVFLQPFIATTYITFITNGLIIFYLATNIKNYGLFFDYMKPFIIFSLIYAVVVYTASKVLGIYADMNIAYAILPAALASLVIAYREKKMRYYIYLAMFSIMLLVLGNRGTILILIVFAIGYTMLHNGKFDIKSIITPFILLSILLLFTFLVVSNLNMIDNLRIFSILSDKSFFQDNIRMKLWTDGIRFAIENPLSIQGAVYDRIFYFMKYAYSHDIGFYIDETMISGLYAHNLLVELIVNFGFVFGAIITIFIIYNILKVLWIHRNRVEFILYVISIGFIQLMYSSSYLTSMWFWFMLGAIYSIIRNESLTHLSSELDL